MVLEVRADLGVFGDGRDAKAREMGGIADAGDLQELRALHGAR